MWESGKVGRAGPGRVSALSEVSPPCYFVGMATATKTEQKLITLLAGDRDGRTLDPAQTLAQMGQATFLATCGGRWAKIRDSYGDTVGVLLFCGESRAVEIVLNFLDYYNVRRVRLVHRGEQAGTVVEEYKAQDVDCFQLAETVWTAGCWK